MMCKTTYFAIYWLKFGFFVFLKYMQRTRQTAKVVRFSYPESQKPCRRVSIADRKVFARIYKIDHKIKPKHTKQHKK